MGRQTGRSLIMLFLELMVAIISSQILDFCVITATSKKQVMTHVNVGSGISGK